MTGFGRGKAENHLVSATVEISGLNRKQVEVVPQVPRALAASYEPKIRQMVLKEVSRGRVQVSVKVEASEDVVPTPQIDHAKAKAYFSVLRELESLRGSPIVVTPADLKEFFHPGTQELDGEAAWPVCESAVDEALIAFQLMRAEEGQHLLDDTLARLKTLAEIVDKLEARAPEVVAHYRKALHQRLAEAGLDLPLDDEKLLREIGLFAERCDISEEITRLRSHLEKFHDYLSKDEAVGRALDFLCQETHREFNTIGSKANDATLAQTIVTAKTELEKLREQIQNVE